ncbi:MAG: type II-A CRISPR-associated protein Csn2 [Roseburia sp.]
MNLVRSEWGMNIALLENESTVLVIESPEIMMEIVSDMLLQSQGEDGRIVLSENGELFSFEKKAELVLNPFSIDLNNKKIRARLYQELKKEADDSYYQDFLKLVSEIQRYLEKISGSFSYPISYQTELEVTSLLKACEVGIDEEKEALCPKIIEYLKIMGQLCGTELFVFVNLKAYLKESEILELYKTAYYCKIKVLMIENQTRKLLSNEKMYIIDSDKCLIEC